MIRSAGLEVAADKDYLWTDSLPILGSNYYRLKEVEYDGSYSYSSVRMVEWTKAVPAIGPNPVRDFLKLAIPSPTDHSSSLEVRDMTGRVFMHRIIAPGTREYTLRGLENLIPGWYMVRFQNEEETHTWPLLKE